MDRYISFDIILILFVATIGGYIGYRLKIPAGGLIGSMVAVAIAVNVYGDVVLPKELQLVAQILLGALIGLSVNHLFFKTLKVIWIPALIMVVCLAIGNIIMGIVIFKFTKMDWFTAMFSVSPGGLTEMAMLAESYSADTITVITMHMIRLITVVTAFPLLVKWIGKLLKTG